MPDDSLFTELRLLGHEVIDLVEHNWFRIFLDGKSHGSDWGTAIRRGVDEYKPDVLLVSKGAYFRNGNLWAIDEVTLWSLRSQCKLLYLSYDDPAFTPMALRDRIAAPFHFWGTSCPGIVKVFPDLFPTCFRGRVFESWLGWDRRTPAAEKDPALACDVAITGHPYWKPFPDPHYQGGFKTVRKDLVKAFRDRGLTVGLWGPDQWLDDQAGGDSSFAPLYRGHVPPEQIYKVHANAKVCVATHLVEGGRYDSGRIPWVGGAGGCLLHERRPGLPEEFDNKIAWFTPGDIQEAADAAVHLCGNEHLRVTMAKKLQEYVLEHHTWKNRAIDIVRVLEGG